MKTEAFDAFKEAVAQSAMVELGMMSASEFRLRRPVPLSYGTVYMPGRVWEIAHHECWHCGRERGKASQQRACPGCGSDKLR